MPSNSFLIVEFLWEADLSVQFNQFSFPEPLVLSCPRRNLKIWPKIKCCRFKRHILAAALCHSSINSQCVAAAQKQKEAVQLWRTTFHWVRPALCHLSTGSDAAATQSAQPAKGGWRRAPPPAAPPVLWLIRAPPSRTFPPPPARSHAPGRGSQGRLQERSAQRKSGWGKKNSSRPFHVCHPSLPSLRDLLSWKREDFGVSLSPFSTLIPNTCVPQIPFWTHLFCTPALEPDWYPCLSVCAAHIIHRAMLDLEYFASLLLLMCQNEADSDFMFLTGWGMLVSVIFSVILKSWP